MAFPTKSSLKYHLQSKKHKECSIINELLTNTFIVKHL